MQMIKKDLLVVIPTLNRYDGVLELIRSIESGTVKPSCYLIVDNGGKFADYVKNKQTPSSVEVFTPGSNIGVAAAWNIGLAREYEYTIVSGDDSLVQERTIEELLQSAQTRKDAFVFPTFINGGKHSDWAFFLQTKQLTKKVGFYDERFWPGYFEDNDYELRLFQSGIKPIHSVNAKVFHVGGATSTQFDWSVRFEVNKLRYIEKWGGEPGHEIRHMKDVKNYQDEDHFHRRNKITILLPHLSLGDAKREEGLQRCIRSLLVQTYKASNFQILILDGEDETVPQKIARGVKESHGDYIVFAANDMEFDANAILFAWEDSVRNKKELISFNGGDVLPDEGNICEHFLIKKSLINRLENGELFSTDFHHTCVDNWLWAQAKKMNQAMRSERAKFTHYHFSKPGGSMDSVYNRGWDGEKLKQDREKLKNKMSTLETTKKLKIVAYTITKNEEKFIERYCESAKDADEVIIIDTGSTDKTIEIAKKCGATVHSISVSPWRFDVARNASLALLPADADICMAIDADELFEEGWREEMERVWVPGTTRLRYLYDWGRDIQFMCDKIHARKGYMWKHPCHERLQNDGRVPEVYAETKMLMITHKPDPDKSRGQYLDLLKLAASEDPHCPRNAFYYSRELTFYAKHEEAVTELKRYLKLPAATWKDERAFAMRLIGKSLEGLRELDDGALYWFEKGVKEAPHRRETWFALTEAYYRRKMWKECVETAEKTLTVETCRNDWPVDAEAWGYLTHDYLAISAYYSGDREKAMRHGAIALSMEPNDERLKKNMEWYAGVID